MSKQRKSEKDKQSGFSEYHYKLGTKYLSDFDSVSSTNGIIHETENQIYSQYQYSDNTPTVTNFIETKFKATDYLRNLIKSNKGDSQILMFCNLTKEVNSNRKADNYAHFYLVVESEGKMPFYVMEVSMSVNNFINYKHVATINTKDEYVSFFK